MIPIVKHVCEGKSVFIQIQNNPTKQMSAKKKIFHCITQLIAYK